MRIELSFTRVLAFASFFLALIAAVELGTGNKVDPDWLGYGSLAALALAVCCG